ncbi:MAG: hypothetical protein Q9163_001250 [Psora crenata]
MAGHAKQTNGVRRVPSSLSKVSTMPTVASSKQNKTTKPSMIVQLRLSAAHLSDFPRDPPPTDLTDTKPSSSTVAKSPALRASASAPIKSENDVSLSVSGAGYDPQTSNTKLEQEGESAGVKTGVKRELDDGVASEDKIKPKPAQRKRPRVGESGRIDGRTAAAKAMGYNPAAHKLGPKANQGIINEKLRALDRTSKPCRKWQKTVFKLKSFTGKVWELPTWRTPQVRAFGEAAESQDGSSNETSKDNSSSNVGSDKSPAVDNPDVPSSPVRIAPVPA